MTNRSRPADDQLGSHPRERGPVSRLIAQGSDWSAAEYICSAGPNDPSFEERHEGFTFAAVVEGSFRYETDTGTALLHPGSWLLGNFGQCFCCGHDHSRGDRCVAFHIGPELFAEIASSIGDTARYTFGLPMLPVSDRRLALAATTTSLVSNKSGLLREEALIRLAEAVISETSQTQTVPQLASRKDERRISAALHQLEDRFAEAVSLDDLAASVGMSKYHFLRTFRSIVGRSPYQYLVDFRLLRVADRMVTGTEPVVDIALACGFGDISTFVSHFRKRFGEPPSRFRRRYQ